jgi:hypothetical protein
MIAPLFSDLRSETRLALRCWARPSLIGIVCFFGAAVLVGALMIAGGLSGATVTAALELAAPMFAALLIVALLGPVLRCAPARLRRRAWAGVVMGRLIAAVALGVAGALLLVTPSMLLGPVEGLGAAVPGAAVSTFYVASVCAAVYCLTRSPAGAIGTAVVLCGLDLVFGFSANPLLSLQGAAALAAGAPFKQFWLVGKATLGGLGLLGAVISVWMAGRTPSSRTRQMAWAVPTAAAVAFVGIGAGFTLAYLYANRDLVAPDLTGSLSDWTARYQPLPVRALLTPAGRALADPRLREGSTRDLRPVLMQRLAIQRPNDPWSDGLAMAAARRQALVQPDSAATLYTAVADHFPRSLFAPRALEASIPRREPLDAERLVLARRILRDYPTSPSAGAVAASFADNYPETVPPEDMKAAALLAARRARGSTKVRWLIVAANAALANGGVDEARALVAEARKRIQSGEVPMTVRLGVEREVNAVAEQIQP